MRFERGDVYHRVPMAGFAETIAEAYAVDGPSIDLGRGVHEGAVAPEAAVTVPLGMMTRHGLIAGATGTGKTVTVQVLAEQLSAHGVPVFVADVKGDLSGLAVPGDADGPAPRRMADLGLPYEPCGFPVQYLSLGGIGPGIPVRATVSDFGPQSCSRRSSTPTRRRSRASPSSFRFADEHGLPLLDLSDLRALLTYLDDRAGQDRLSRGSEGCRSRRSACSCVRSSALEDAGGSELFGEPQLDIADLMRVGARRARRDLLPGAARRPGPAPPVLDGTDVVARGALRRAAGGRRPPEAEARLLLRRGASPVRRRDRKPSSSRSCRPSG